MPLPEGSISRAPDAAGTPIKVIQDADGRLIQVVAVAGRYGSQAGVKDDAIESSVPELSEFQRIVLGHLALQSACLIEMSGCGLSLEDFLEGEWQ